MKKPLLLLLAFALASLFAQAQDYSCDSLLLYVKRPAEVSGFHHLHPNDICLSLRRLAL